MNSTIHWNTVDNFPNDKNEPILCLTRNNTLCIFKYDSRKNLWNEKYNFIRYKTFEKLVAHYDIEYWAYQKSITI